MNNKITLFWFRQDLRLTDNPGLFEAARQGLVFPIYILDDDNAGEFKMGAASRWWLNHSLLKLNKRLDNKLNFYVGDPKKILLKVIHDNNIDAVYWNRGYEPWRIKEDTLIKALLKNNNIECKSFNASLLKEPWTVLKEDGTPYKVYTAFYKKAYVNLVLDQRPLPKPEKLILIQDPKNKNNVDNIILSSVENWHKKIESCWDVGEQAAQKRLVAFLDRGLLGYKQNRDYPAKNSTSRLSPHLHFGEISPYQIWRRIQTQCASVDHPADVEHFKKELVWREFSYYLLYHFPDLPRENFQSKFDSFPWETNTAFLKAWQTGQTGYPIVDAGMRELWQTGYMHNRIRMVVGSFLVKNGLLHWRHGEDWFWDCLVDADLASNSASWQWIAGSGADAAPYFRIFNPVKQGETFDPDGEYTRHFVPELSCMPLRFLFKPWEAPPDVLAAAGIILGEHYPRPIVNMKASRLQALEAYSRLKFSHYKE